MSNSSSLVSAQNLSLECPKCGKYTIVQQSNSLYRCINCDFKRDLNTKSSSGSGTVLAALLTAIFLMLLI